MAKPKIDLRLLGTWQSDRRRTFQNFRPKPGCSAASLRKFKSLFGKLVVRWSRNKSYTELDGHREITAYEVVASDSKSVVIRYFDTLVEEDRLRQIHFDGDYYWIAVSGRFCEYFRRVKVGDASAERR